jgi:GNAT superfamily N-acetyltransferase
MTVAAEDDTRLAGFMHVVFDDDDRSGSLIDNLHITQDRRRTGIGTALPTRAAETTRLVAGSGSASEKPGTGSLG